MLGQVGQHAAVGDAGLDLGVERSFGKRIANGRFQAIEPLAAGRADRDRAGVMGLENVQVRPIRDLVGLVEHQQGRMVFEPAAPRARP